MTQSPVPKPDPAVTEMFIHDTDEPSVQHLHMMIPLVSMPDNWMWIGTALAAEFIILN